MQFTDEEWIYILKKYLKGWTEIPLNSIYGYDIEEIKFFDGFIGTLIKQTENIYKEYPEFLDKKFVESWIYRGKLYRVIHKNLVIDENEEEHCILPKVDYHRMITHWTSDFTFDGLLHKLSSEEEYIILEADTKDRLAFDVNKFRKAYHCEEKFTKGEQEIIFPMYKDNIKEYRMTINEFIKLKQEEKCCENEKDVKDV